MVCFLSSETVTDSNCFASSNFFSSALGSFFSSMEVGIIGSSLSGIKYSLGGLLKKSLGASYFVVVYNFSLVCGTI
jgi:hypothetical protein